ncbi:hypothetical protein [Rhodopseudomonas sp.]|uniref:hypothetical protein n=1 Tax=Rhodopseudomonas sp. TaxID=1078 RepID=UPI002600A7EB|nr:hypothetical protein [Rhodopseudomonas sp.]
MRLPTLMILLTATVALAGCNEGSGTPGPKGEPGIAGPPGPPGKDGVGGTSLRSVTSNSCSANGCPTACEADETLVSAICMGSASAKFSDTLSVDNGVMTARCGPSFSSIALTCAKK